jgi:hypothetical protein
MSDTPNINRFDLLLFEIRVHLDPQILSNPDEIDSSRLNRKRLKKYSDLIHTMMMAFKKVQKYEIYFSKFYASTEEITEPEALEHHVHAYLQDLTILSNKIGVFLDILKSDLKQVASNKAEICTSIDNVKKRVLRTFKKVKDTRDPHQHKGSRFLDYDITRANSIRSMMQNGNKLFRDKLKPGALDYLDGEATKSFERAKTYYIARAKLNEEGLSKLMSMFFWSIEGLIYQFLGIKPVISGKIKGLPVRPKLKLNK